MRMLSGQFGPEGPDAMRPHRQRSARPADKGLRLCPFEADWAVRGHCHRLPRYMLAQIQKRSPWRFSAGGTFPALRALSCARGRQLLCPAAQRLSEVHLRGSEGALQNRRVQHALEYLGHLAVPLKGAAQKENGSQTLRNVFSTDIR